MKNIKYVQFEALESHVVLRSEILHIKNHKIVPKIPIKPQTLTEVENEWQQEYNFIYNSYVLEKDDE